MLKASTLTLLIYCFFWNYLAYAESIESTSQSTSTESENNDNGDVVDPNEADPDILASNDSLAFLKLKKKKKPALNVPEGFEDLAGPQITAVDVYYGGTYLVTSLVEYTLETIEFLKPEQVLERIPNLTSKPLVLEKLTGPQARNSELVCFNANQKNCGVLDPSFVGIIFDESIFRADIFIEASLLKLVQITKSKYLPDPTNIDLSYLQNLDLNYSSSSAVSDKYTLSGTSYLSKGRQRFVTNFSHSNGGETNIENIAYQMDDKDHEYEAGYFRPRFGSLTFPRSSNISGLAFARSLKSRTDLDYIRGSRLPLYLPLRSQVDIFKEGRLLSSQVYNSGNHEIDTSSLPSGSYDIEIHIKDNAGNVEIVNRFFIKTAKIPPPGEKIYYIEGGRLVERNAEKTMPAMIGEWTLRGGYQKRLNKTMGMSLGFAGVDTHSLFEYGFNWINPTWDLNFQTMASTQADYGLATQLFKRYGNLSGSINVRKMGARYDQSERSRYLLVPRDLNQFSFSVNYFLYGGQLSYSRDIYRYSSDEKTDIRSLGYNKPLFRAGYQSVFFRTEYIDTRIDKTFSLSLDWRYDGHNLRYGVQGEHESLDIHGEQSTTDFIRSLPGNAISDFSPRTAKGKSTTYFNSSADISWFDGNKWPEDIQARAFIQDRRGLTETGLESRASSVYGIGEIEYVDSEFDNGHSRQLTSTRLSTSFGAVNNLFGIGGQKKASASIILDIRSDTKDAVFDVLINGVNYAIARSGRKLVINLKPYETYRIQLQDRGEVFVASTNRAYRVTLYPGNIVPLIIEAPAIKIAFGKVVMNQTVCTFTHEDDCYTMKMPVKNAAIFGTHGYSSTDQNGNFQAEISYLNKHLFVQKHDKACVARLPEDAEINGDLMYLETLTCEATAENSLQDWYEQHPEEDPEFEEKQRKKLKFKELLEEINKPDYEPEDEDLTNRPDEVAQR